MNLELLKDKLGDETFAALKSYVDEIIGKRDAAVVEISTTRKNLRAENEKLKAIKDTLFEKLGLDDDADLDTLPEVKGQAEAAKQFEARLKKLEREKAEALAKAGEAEGRYKGSRLDAELAKVIAAHDFTEPDVIGELFRSKAQWEDDQIYVKEGERMVPLTDAVTNFANTKTTLIKARGRTGSGTPPGAGSAGGKQSTMSRADFEALPPAAKVEAAKSGVQLT